MKELKVFMTNTKGEKKTKVFYLYNDTFKSDMEYVLGYIQCCIDYGVECICE
jgi:hypothetical protein